MCFVCVRISRIGIPLDVCASCARVCLCAILTTKSNERQRRNDTKQVFRKFYSNLCASHLIRWHFFSLAACSLCQVPPPVFCRLVSCGEEEEEEDGGVVFSRKFSGEMASVMFANLCFATDKRTPMSEI